MTLNEFMKAFTKLKAKDWVQSERRGPTGVGQTLQNLLGLPENNIALPDLGEAEIIHNQILAGNILVDLRLHDKITSARNHGTGFRAHEDKLPLLFQTVKDL
ncbi:MAG: hypothetical protein HY884_04170 [Deltaproteobacteria bacterium]|nr:hypothetical protein [Deltaproteobacteria bacterium]